MTLWCNIMLMKFAYNFFSLSKLNRSDLNIIFIENGKGDDRNFLENGRSSIINLTKDEAQIIAQKLSNVVEEYTD